jgi:hypothetical protein
MATSLSIEVSRCPWVLYYCRPPPHRLWKIEKIGAQALYLLCHWRGERQSPGHPIRLRLSWESKSKEPKWDWQLLPFSRETFSIHSIPRRKWNHKNHGFSSSSEFCKKCWKLHLRASGFHPRLSPPPNQHLWLGHWHSVPLKEIFNKYILSWLSL